MEKKQLGKISKKRKNGKIKRDSLISLLNLLHPGLSTVKQEQLSHFLFIEGGICTYNNRLSISVQSEDIYNFNCSIPAKSFYDLLNGMSADYISLEKKSGEIVVNGKSCSFGLSFIDTDNISQSVPVFKISSKNWIKLPSFFEEAVSLCVFSTSKDMTYPFLTCVYFTEDNDIISSDNYRISLFEASKKAKGFEKGLLIPAEALVELLKYNPKEYQISTGWIHFRYDENLVFSIQLLDINSFTDKKFKSFTNSKSYFPKKVGKKIELPIKKLKSAMSKANILLRDEYILKRNVEISFSGKKLKCSVKRDFGWTKEELLLENDYGKFGLNINPDFFEQILSHTTEMVFVDTSKVMFTKGEFKHLLLLIKEK